MDIKAGPQKGREEDSASRVEQFLAPRSDSEFLTAEFEETAGSEEKYKWPPRKPCIANTHLDSCRTTIWISFSDNAFWKGINHSLWVNNIVDKIAWQPD